MTPPLPVPTREGCVCPTFDTVPRHVAIVMDGNGRWANQRGLPRTEGHRAGEETLMDVIAGAIEAGVKVLSVYAFSTENWKRSPAEVAFLMGYSRDVIHRRRDELNSWGVKVVWSGREPRLWKSVIRELKEAERLTAANSVITVNFCVNYGGRAELQDAMRSLAADIRSGALSGERISESAITARLYQPGLPDVDLFIRTGGEQRLSNFLLWQAAYAELSFIPELWPEVNRTHLWREIAAFGGRERRYGGAIDAVTADKKRSLDETH